MKRKLVAIFSVVMLLAVLVISGGVASASNFFLNFENGTEGATVTGIPGVTLEDFNGYNPLYGDSRTGGYNTHSDDLNYGSGSYHHNGNFFVWAGPNADARGVKVDFTNNDGTWFKTGYSAYSEFFIDAYLTNGSVVSVSGAANTGNPMGYLTVNATTGLYIDYIVLHDTGNYWLVDDMSGDTSGVGVPEPTTTLLLGAGLMGLAWVRRKFHN